MQILCYYVKSYIIIKIVIKPGKSRLMLLSMTYFCYLILFYYQVIYPSSSTVVAELDFK